MFMWNRALATVPCAFCRPHLQNVVWTRQSLTISMYQHMWSTDEMKLLPQSRAHFVDPIVDLIFKKCILFCDFYVKSSSRYSPVRILSTSSSKCGLNSSVFDDFYVSTYVVDRWNEALATVARTLCRPHCRSHLQKLHSFFATFMWNRALATVPCAFCRPHLQNVVWTRQSLTIFMYQLWWRCGRQMKWSSCYSRAHTLSTPLSTSASKNSFFFDVYVFFLWLQSCAHFVDLIFKKWSEPVIFFCDIYVKSSFRYSLVHILLTAFRIEARARGNRDPPAATMDRHFTWKKNRVLRPRVFSAVNSRVL